MLSFKNKDKEPFLIITDLKNGKILHEVHVVPPKDKPAIEIDPDDLLSNLNELDFEKAFQTSRIKDIHVNMVSEAIKTLDPSRLSDKLKQVYTKLVDIAQNKTKTYLEFDGDILTLPLMQGQKNKKKYDRPYVISGPSNSGKTFLMARIAEQDTLERPVFYICPSHEDEEVDPSLSPLVKQRRIEFIKLRNEDDVMNLPSKDMLKDAIVVFDDCGSIPADMANEVLSYRDQILKRGRHTNTTCIVLNHITLGGHKTRVPLQEAEWVILFPKASSHVATSFLRDRVRMTTKEAKHLIELSKSHGRYLGIHLGSPEMFITQKAVILA